MSESLKPCPFCGGEAKFVESRDSVIPGKLEAVAWKVQCSKCGASTLPNNYYGYKKDAVACWNTRAERTKQNVTDAWNEWGVNVFNDESLDDFGRFEKVYQICQEIVEPIEFTCHVRELGGIQGSIPVLLCRACGEPNYARADGSVWNYCPNCGSKVVE